MCKISGKKATYNTNLNSCKSLSQVLRHEYSFWTKYQSIVGNTPPLHHAYKMFIYIHISGGLGVIILYSALERSGLKEEYLARGHDTETMTKT